MSVLEFYSAPYLTLDARLFPYGSDTLATSGHLHHATNRIGLYTMTFTGISGAHTVHAFQSGDFIGLGHVYITDGATNRVGDATVVNVDTVTNLTELMGSGSDRCTQTLDDGSNPIENMAVWVTTDSAGNDIYAGTLYTDSNGQVTFMLDAGNTYYLWAQKGGYNSIQGTAFTAVAD